MTRCLRWVDVDPATHPFDGGTAAVAIAAQHVHAAAIGGDRRARDVDRDQLERAIDRGLVARYGAWVAGWNWAASEPGGGGPIRGWCCARDSVLPGDDRDPQATVDRVAGAVGELRALLEELARRFAELRAATASLPLERGLEHAAADLLPLVLAWTGAEDAWYGTFARVLAWYVESFGGEPEAFAAIAEVVGGRFASWVAPTAEVAAATCAAVGDAIALALIDDAVHDALPAWRATRARAFTHAPAARPYPPLDGDAHDRYIDGPERARDPVRAARMAAALAACRASAARGEPLTFARLADWQALALGTARAGFRTAAAYARGGRVCYQLGDRTHAEFEAALADADAPAPVAVRAARVYLDVCFFHPFDDGNARAARLALDHVLTRAGLGLASVEPVFVIARAADDAGGAYGLAWAIDYLLGQRSAG